MGMAAPSRLLRARRPRCRQAGAWEHYLQWTCQQLSWQSGRRNGSFVAVVLDTEGLALDLQAAMSEVDAGNAVQMLVLLGGPGGIKPRDKASIMRIIATHTEDVVEVSLVGGVMHSYEADGSLIAAERANSQPAQQFRNRAG